MLIILGVFLIANKFTYLPVQVKLETRKEFTGVAAKRSCILFKFSTTGIL